jgi:hypothetical protein
LLSRSFANVIAITVCPFESALSEAGWPTPPLTLGNLLGFFEVEAKNDAFSENAR